MELVAQGDTKLAHREFSKARNQKNNGRDNVAGLLALAALTFGSASYSQALAL